MFPSLATVIRNSQKADFNPGNSATRSKVSLDQNLQEYLADSTAFYLPDGRAFMGRQKKIYADPGPVRIMRTKSKSQFNAVEEVLWQTSGLSKPKASVKLKNHLASLSFASPTHEEQSQTQVHSHNTTMLERSTWKGQTKEVGLSTQSSFYLRTTAGRKSRHNLSTASMSGKSKHMRSSSCLLTQSGGESMEKLGFLPSTPMYSPLVHINTAG